MRRAEKAGTGQSGQILYLTLILFMLSATFALGIVNVIYLAAVKIKLQNAADQLALSAATLKARVLNQVTRLNGILEFVALENGQVPSRPYYSAIDMTAGWNVAESANASALKTIRDYHLQIYSLLGRIARENGLAPGLTKAGFYTLPIRAERDFSWEQETIRYWQEIPYPPGKVLLTNPLFPAVRIEPRHAPWFVQTRLEWRTKDSVAGGRWLRVKLPVLEARGRAEIYDAAVRAKSWNHHWRVRLRAPDEAVDDYIRRW